VRKPFNDLEGTALYVVILLLFGILVYKIFGHLALESTVTQVLTVIQIIAALVLSWIAGWRRDRDE
jgi:threonine/homoserine/homoserine lactone efflux protein